MMNRRAFMMTGAASGLVPALFPGQAAAEALNYDALAMLRQIGLPEESSEVMSTASYMMDVLGPRLSGSPGIRKSAEWVVEKLKGWGMTGAALEPWPEDPTGTNNGFPRGWANEKFYLHATSPNAFPISGMSIAWTPGTNGRVSGECVLVTDMDEGDLRRRFTGKLKGKWILGQTPGEMRAQWDPVARRLTQTDLDLLETPARPPEKGDPPAAASSSTAQQAYNRNTFFLEQGALGVLSTNKGHGVVNVNGGSRTDAPDVVIPRIQIEAEHYGRIARSVLQGQPVVIEADIRNTWYDNPEMFNVVGEIRGSEQPNEVVIIGGHFDSFHSATGATDNGGPCAAVMEAMRLLKLTKTPLKRTVRICLWNGEEQGLIGSRLYVAQHFGGVRGVPSPGNPRGDVVPIKRDHSRFQAYFNIDNGAGSIRGVHNQGNRAIVPVFRQWMEPLRDLGVTHVSQRVSRSTDHVSFDDAGLPGFQFIQDPMEYEPKTHHTNMDFFEALQPEDMRRNSVILASFAAMAANHPGFLPRKPRA
jgi:carboxypeptidase Q